MEKVFQPIRIGNVDLKNRIVMAAMAVGFSVEHGYISRRGIDYYSARAKGGAGLITVEIAHVHKHGLAARDVPNIFHDRYVPRLRLLTEAIHEGGAKAALQLCFMGSPSLTGTHLLPVPSTFSPKTRELHPQEMEAIAAAYGDAARRAQAAGFDMVQLHACHGSLLCMFLSPFYNKRTDRYGGPDGGAQFILEIVRTIKERTGGDLPVSVRMNGDDALGDRGTTLAVAQGVARILVGGGVDALDISSGLREPTSIYAPMGMPLGYRLHLAAGIKAVVGAPVTASGAILDLSLAEQALQTGMADLIAFARPLLADPDLPAKALAGRHDDIRPCTRCLTCVETRGKDMVCMGNASLGHERDMVVKAAGRRRKVVVVGGGPGGMEAARVAALRGHQVVLFERDGTLGGQLRLAAVPPGKGDLKKLTDFLIGQITKLGVRVELGREATLETIKAEQADVVVVATGATPAVPSFASSGAGNVVTAWQVLEGHDVPEGTIIVVGGGRIGCETADLLAAAGRQVTLIVVVDEPAWDMDAVNRKLLLERLRARGVNIRTGLRITGIDETGVTAGQGVFGVPPEERIEGNVVVLATGMTPRSALARELEGHFSEIHAVGDCVEARTAVEAIREGYRTALSI